MTTYHVTVTRDEDLWVATVHGLPAHMLGVTDVARFADLDVEVRDLVAGLTDTDPDTFDLAWRYVIGGTDVTTQVQRLIEDERALRAASARRDQDRRKIVSALSGAGMSQTTIGDVLGLSHQRVHQLIKTGA